MNLIIDRRIPVIRRDGTREKISPTQLTSKPKNPIIAIASSRADFDAMYTLWLVGLVQTFLSPENDKKWEELLKNPPSEEELSSIFDDSFFNMDGNGPQFMQDLNPKEMIKKFSVSSLLFESPGELTVREGRDLFQQEGTVKTLCPSCTAIALYTRQANNTMKGQGYVTPGRSGARAPVTTLIKGDTLWKTIWLNVLNKKDFFALGGNPKKAIFPWTEKTVDSQKKDRVSLNDKHPAYCFWEMPLRYNVLFEEADTACDICGTSEKKMVTHVMAKNYGNKVIDPRHTLSPSMDGKEGIMFRGCTYPYSNTDYTALISYLIPSEGRYIAKNVKNFLTKRKTPVSSFPLFPPDVSLWIFGYMLEKAKYYGWVETTCPFPDIKGKEELIAGVIDTANKIAWITEYNVKRMRLSRSAMARNNIIAVRENFFSMTEIDFFMLLDDSDVEAWLSKVVKKAFYVFDKFMDDKKIGLQFYFKLQMLEEINKYAVEKFNVTPLKREDYIKYTPRTYKAPRFFEKKTRSLLMSWWKRQEMVSKKHAFFTRCVSAEEVIDSTYFDELIDILNSFKTNGNGAKERLALGLIIVSKIDQTRVDLSEPFPVQLIKNQVNDRHIIELLTIDDAAKNWKVFEGVIRQLKTVNIIGFLECFINWCPEIKDHWKKVTKL